MSLLNQTRPALRTSGMKSSCLAIWATSVFRLWSSQRYMRHNLLRLPRGKVNTWLNVSKKDLQACLEANLTTSGDRSVQSSVNIVLFGWDTIFSEMTEY